jgi:hypothetical protein
MSKYHHYPVCGICRALGKVANCKECDELTKPKRSYMKLHAHKNFTGSFLIEDEKGFAVARLIDDYYEDEKLAKLMASAPELLEALEAVLSNLSLADINSSAGMIVAYNSATDAIAKAKGEQP